MIRVKVTDEESRVVFLEMEFLPDEFMRALTGMGYTGAAKSEVRGLEYVGKKKITETRQAIYLGSSFDEREKVVAWLESNCQEEGWIIDSYLGSQGSINRQGGKTVLNYRVFRYEAQPV